MDDGELAEYLAELATRAVHVNPSRQVPLGEAGEAEIDLQASESESERGDAQSPCPRSVRSEASSASLGRVRD